MTPTDAELRKLAEAATKGPWTAHVVNECQCDDCGKSERAGIPRPAHHDAAYVSEPLVCDESDGDMLSAENAAFIAALNPTVALSLLDRIAAKDREIERSEQRRCEETVQLVSRISDLERKCAAMRHALITQCEQDSLGNWHEIGCGGRCTESGACAQIRAALSNLDRISGETK
jgi:chorismate synthase